MENLRTDPALLARLIDAARNHKMTPAERYEQRISLIYGLLPSRSTMTKDGVRRWVAEQYGPAPTIHPEQA